MRIECLMQDYRTKIIVEAPNEKVAEVIAIGRYAEQTNGLLGEVKAFKRIYEDR